jgi:hypothetical protein
MRRPFRGVAFFTLSSIMKRSIILATLAAIALTRAAFGAGENTSGSFTVTATVSSLMTVTVDTLGGSVNGLGTRTLSTNIGGLSRTSNLLSGVTRTMDSTSMTFTVAAGFTIGGRNLSTNSVTVGVQLHSAPPAGLTWSISRSGQTPVVATTDVTIVDIAQSLGSGRQYPINLKVNSTFYGGFDQTISVIFWGN